jgi:hypothetical protein
MGPLCGSYEGLWGLNGGRMGTFCGPYVGLIRVLLGPYGGPPSGRTIALGSSQPLTEMSTRNIS